MGSEWKTVTINDVAEVIGGGTPSSNVPEYWGEDIPWITPKDLSSHHARDIEKGERNISHLGLKKSSARLLPARTVLITSRAPIGYVAIAKNEVATNQGFKSLILNPDQSSDFFYYLIKFNVPKLEAHSSGSTFKEISGSVLKQIELTIPPLPEQKAIAHILGTLDDKIELNRKMNATLEAMAQALFKSWFVDFDPVIDNALAAGNPIPDELAPRAEVRRQALANGTANREAAKTFPASFQETEAMGWIPEGWKVHNWGNIATLNYGKSIKGYRESNGSIPVFGTNGAIGFTDTAMFEGEGIIIGRKGAYRGVHYSPSDFSVIDTAFYLVPQIPLSMKWSYYELLRFDINGMDSGSAIPSTSREDFYGLESVIPPLESQRRFDSILNSFYSKKLLNDEQSSQLTKLRDTLLPKLISGELSLPANQSLTA